MYIHHKMKSQLHLTFDLMTSNVKEINHKFRFPISPHHHPLYLTRAGDKATQAFGLLPRFDLCAPQ